MRMIERLGVFARQAARMRSQGVPDEAREVIEEAAVKLVGLPWSHFRDEPLERVIELVSLGGQLDVGKAWVVGRLMLEDAELDREVNPMGFYQKVHKALHLFSEAGSRTEEESREQCIRGIEQATRVIGEVPIDPNTQLRIMQFFEDAALFGNAEDWLFRYQDTVERRKHDLVAVQFYRRLSLLSDEALLEGGLPRGEVEESVAELGLSL